MPENPPDRLRWGKTKEVVSMPMGFWIAVGIQIVVFILMLIGRNKIANDD